MLSSSPTLPRQVESHDRKAYPAHLSHRIRRSWRHLGQDLAKAGAEVTTFDILLRAEPSRSAMLAKARQRTCALAILCSTRFVMPIC